MSHLINFFPIGRLGNVMFQTAACIGYAKRYGCEWGAPTDMREVPYFHKVFPGVRRLDGNYRRYNCADPRQYPYMEIPFQKRDTTLVGFFQSIKFFENSQEEVKKVFRLNINPVDAVSIHIRRGDFVGNERHFPTVNGEYIPKAMDKFQGEKFIVFSDDIPWCRQHIKGDNVEYSKGSEFDDLSLMASCKHNIIANSTFSWWSAYLNPNPDKIIICPNYKGWYGPDNGVIVAGGVEACKDLIPEGWIQI